MVGILASYGITKSQLGKRLGLLKCSSDEKPGSKSLVISAVGVIVLARMFSDPYFGPFSPDRPKPHQTVPFDSGRALHATTDYRKPAQPTHNPRWAEEYRNSTAPKTEASELLPTRGTWTYLHESPFPDRPRSTGPTSHAEQPTLREAGEIENFIRTHHSKISERDAVGFINDYGDHVDYFDHGTVDRDFIRKNPREHQNYLSVRESAGDHFEWSRKSQNDQVSVGYRLFIDWRNTDGTKGSGTMDVTIAVEKQAAGWRITKQYGTAITTYPEDSDGNGL